MLSALIWCDCINELSKKGLVHIVWLVLGWSSGVPLMSGIVAVFGQCARQIFGTMFTKKWHEVKIPQERLSAPYSSGRVSWTTCSVSLELPCWGTWQSPMPQSALQPSLKAFLPDSLLASSSASKSHQWIWRHPWPYTTHCAILILSLVTDFLPPVILILRLACVVFFFRPIHSSLWPWCTKELHTPLERP
jgi:hypothetical protein